MRSLRLTDGGGKGLVSATEDELVLFPLHEQTENC
jgi:hypothetical protein